MFFVRAPVDSGQSYGEVLGSYGLSESQQITALQHPGNAHIARGTPPARLRGLLNLRSVRGSTVMVPIDIQLSVTAFQAVIDLADGLRPRPVGASGPPTLTHGVSIRVARRLGHSTNLKWIQTVRKLNNPDPNAPLEFVDGGINNEPFYYGRRVAPVEFDDVPCGPVAPAPGAGVDFTAMTTLSVLAGQHIILAAGKVWGFRINTATTLPAGVTERRPQDATAVDFRNQLRILRAGVNQFGDPSGPDLGYMLPPAAGRVVP